ncbi:hypothetical protein [Paenibacillus sp. UNC499MF]|uniref:hypothetical protein n=1 Tax=Paenibacillus sp. UNC499MF TaxID=1502751 RepID=UPI0011AFD7A4|nr:hypothetical protein [Paenibacillus sp. UNC499MF]
MKSYFLYYRKVESEYNKTPSKFIKKPTVGGKEAKRSKRPRVLLREGDRKVTAGLRTGDEGMTEEGMNIERARKEANEK